MPASSLIRSTIDFDAPGAQNGYLEVPHSVHRSAYGRILIPLSVINGSDGPTVLLTGGVHGDEYEGPIALYRFMADLDPASVRGRLIVIPALNYPAYEAGLRVSPIDDVNLNRTFPGERNGTITQMIAHFISSELHPRADVHLDFHSGGSSLQYLPVLLVPEWSGSDDMHDRLVALVDAFGADRAVWFDATNAMATDDRVISNSAHAGNCLFLTGEFGGGSTINLDGLALAENGIGNILRHLGVLDGAPAVPKAPARYAMGDPGLFAYAPRDGIFEPAYRLGETLDPGALAGRIHDPLNPWDPPVEVRFAAGGLAVCIRTFCGVKAGDCLGHLARSTRA